MLNSLLQPLLGLGGWEAYLLVAALCFGEAALLLGFVLPGETAVVFGGILAAEGHVSLVPLLVLVVASAILGDTVGYEAGRHLGPVLLRHRPLRNQAAVARAQEFVKRRGSLAVFLGRFTAVFRTLVPGVAGMSGVSYPAFALANALGGLIWGVGYTVAGYYFGKVVLSAGTDVSAAVIAGVALVLIGLEARKRMAARKARRTAGEPSQEQPTEGLSGPAVERPGGGPSGDGAGGGSAGTLPSREALPDKSRPEESTIEAPDGRLSGARSRAGAGSGTAASRQAPTRPTEEL